MHEYDAALKRILTRPGSRLLAALTGSDRLRWLNVETPQVRNLRLDLPGQLPDKQLVAIEFQSRNEKDFPMRMGEYLFATGRTYGRLPRQIVLYVGEPPLRMKDRIETPDLSFRFHLVDIRDPDGVALLASRNLGDNVLVILTRLGARPDTVRCILDRIAHAPAAARDEAFAELLIVAGLRKPGGEIKTEAKKMPILNDIMDHGVIGPLIRQGRAEGQMEMLLSMMEKRFGSVPPRIRKRLAALKPKEIKAASLRLLDAERIDDLFKR